MLRFERLPCSSSRVSCVTTPCLWGTCFTRKRGRSLPYLGVALQAEGVADGVCAGEGRCPPEASTLIHDLKAHGISNSWAMNWVRAEASPEASPSPAATPSPEKPAEDRRTRAQNLRSHPALTPSEDRGLCKDSVGAPRRLTGVFLDLIVAPATSVEARTPDGTVLQVGRSSSRSG